MRNKTVHNKMLCNKIVRNKIVRNKIVRNNILCNKIVYNKILRDKILRNTVVYNKIMHNKIVHNKSETIPCTVTSLSNITNIASIITVGIRPCALELGLSDMTLSSSISSLYLQTATGACR